MRIDLTSWRQQLASGRGNWLTRVLAVAVTVLALVVGAALAAFFFGFCLVLAAVAGVWLWWKQWRLRRRAGRRATTAGHSDDVIQGEYEIVHESTETRYSHDRSHDSQRQENTRS
ncbi:MAG: hypothetical protein R3202_02515 [Candidatus Competibacterales bacterium]|nr:hypothetical protein [Candidatus Competibacterales bacterium]